MTPLQKQLAAKQAELARITAALQQCAGPPDPVDFASTQLGMQCDAWQAQALRSASPRILLNCSRQAGKSTATAVLALWWAVYKPKSLVLLISPSLRQSAELFRKVSDAMHAMRAPPECREDNRLSVALANGSRIVSLPSTEATIRGFSAVSLIIEDEAAFVPDSLHSAVQPMLAVSGGQMVMMSTPNGRRGHFFDAWEHGGDAWERIKITAYQVPRIPAEFLEQERRSLGSLFPQEYLGEFVNAATGRVYAGYDPAVNRIERLPGDANTKWTYLLGLDFGIVDDNGISVLARRPHDTTDYIVTSYRLHADARGMAEEYKRLATRFAFEQVVGDIGGMGKAFAAEMSNHHGIPMQAAQKHNKLGYISLMNGALRNGTIKVLGPYCADLIEEWETLPWAINGKQEAGGFPNHASDSACYVWRASPSHHEQPAAVHPKAGTREAAEAEERAMLERDEASLDRKPWQRDKVGGDLWSSNRFSAWRR